MLTGLIAGMTAMGLDAFEAACLAVYVHGKAGIMRHQAKAEPE